MINIAVLVSGGGTNLQALIDAQGTTLQHGRIALVIASNENAYALQRAQNANIDHCVVSRKYFQDQEEFTNALLKQLQEHNIDMIVLAGYLSVIDEKIIHAYPDRIINIHPSLIPSFCGKGYYGLKVHQAALAYGVKVTGATIHYVNEIMDGGKIILQKAVEILPDDTPEILQQRVMKEAEWILLPKATEMIAKQIEQEKTK
ncbi:MAG: phosphoribosylglycinamide formyltransferase [Erysipelotrichaceae bacterium]|nr:phosphoribosylglycinamide formyltransferase [Erysipelotrichaceae bacterium]